MRWCGFIKKQLPGFRLTAAIMKRGYMLFFHKLSITDFIITNELQKVNS